MCYLNNIIRAITMVWGHKVHAPLMFFDYLNGLYINVLLIIMANLLVTRCQKTVSPSNGFLLQWKRLLRVSEIKVMLHFYLLHILSSGRFFLLRIHLHWLVCVWLCKLPDVFVFSFPSQTRCDFHQERSTEYVSERNTYVSAEDKTCLCTS